MDQENILIFVSNKKDRENADNTITILRERSRTFTNMSINKIDENDDKVTFKRQSKQNILIFSFQNLFPTYFTSNLTKNKIY